MVSVIALVAAFVGGLAAGRLGALVADRFAPPVRAHPHQMQDQAPPAQTRGPVPWRRRPGGGGRLLGRPGRAVRRRVPLQELVTAAATVAVVARFDVGWTMVPPLVAAVSLVTLSVVDLRAYRLPDAITFPALGLSLAAVAAEAVAAGRSDAVVSAVAAALGYGAVLWIAHELRPDALGFGDVKLGLLLGLHLGWAAGVFGRGWLDVVALVAQALLLGCLIGLGLALILWQMRRRGRDPLPHPDRDPATVRNSRLLQTVLPFGPALAAGTLIAVLFADLLVG